MNTFFTEKYFEIKNLSLKDKILLNIQLNKPNKKKESIDKLIYNFQELEEVLNFINIKKENIPKFIYDNMDNIHYILYYSEEFINLDTFEIKAELRNYFYLSLLIDQNSEIVNYIYSFDFINRLLNLIKKNKEKKFKKIILSKIILDIIKNFEGLENYDEDTMKEEIDKIKNDSIRIIDENIGIFNDLKIKINSDNIINNKIDYLYSEIINGIIKSKINYDNEYAYKLLKELDIKDIYLTNTIINNLNETLNNEEYINDLKIEKKEDLINSKKIDFYYIIMKYILKDSIYIYQIPFLLNTRKLILNLIKLDELPLDKSNINIKEKLEYIIRIIADVDYYFEKKKIPKKDLIKLKEVLNYYKECVFESKKEDIVIIENIIKNNKLNYKKYLEDYDSTKNMHERISFLNLKAEDIHYAKENTQNNSDIESSNTKNQNVKNDKIYKTNNNAKGNLNEENNKRNKGIFPLKEKKANKEIYEELTNKNKYLKNKNKSNANKKSFNFDYNEKRKEKDKSIKKKNEKNSLVEAFAEKRLKQKNNNSIANNKNYQKKEWNNICYKSEKSRFDFCKKDNEENNNNNVILPEHIINLINIKINSNPLTKFMNQKIIDNLIINDSIKKDNKIKDDEWIKILNDWNI